MAKRKLNVAQLARDHGLKGGTVRHRIRQGMTPEQAISEPVEGYLKRAWKNNREKILKTIRLSRLLIYVAISPEGGRIEIDDLPKFCKEHGFRYGSVSNCTRTNKTYKGWTIRKLSDATQEASSRTD